MCRMVYTEKYVNKYFVACYDVQCSEAVLLVFHGLLESTERYEEVARYLSNYGISVVVFDMPGHGRTTVTPSGVCRSSDVITAMNLMYSYAVRRYCGKRVIVFGHSMGAFYGRIWLRQHNDVTAIFTGTGTYRHVVIHMARFLVRIFGTASLTVACHLASLRFLSVERYSWISRDKQEVLKFPVYDIKISTESILDLLNTMVEYDSECQALILSGTSDVLGCRLSKFRRVIRYCGARHELLHEINRYEVFEEIRKEIMLHCERRENF